MALAVLSIDVEAKLASLEAGMDKAGRLVEKNAQQMSRAFDGLKAASVAIGATLATAFAGGQLTAFFRSTVDGLDALNDLRDATGASIENISALEDVAARTGTSFESMAGSLVKFNKVLNEAKPGSETAEILKAIGVNADELKRIDPAEALRQTAVALSQYAVNGDKARAIQLLFGKSIQEAAPFLKDLAESGRLNATVTTEQAQAAEDFNKQLFSMQKNTTDAGRALASELLPKLEALFTSTEKGAKAFNLLGLAAGPLSVVFETVSVLGANVAFVLKGIGREIGAIAAQSVALASLDFAGFRTISEAVRADGERARKELDELERRLLNRPAPFSLGLNTGSGPRTGPNDGLSSLKLPPEAGKDAAKAAKAAKAFSDYQDLINSKVGNLLEDSDVVRAQELNDQMTRLYELFQLGLPGDLVASAQAKLRGNALVGPVIPPEDLERMKRLKDLIEATPTAKLEESRKDMQLLGQAFEEGAISAEQFGEAAQTALGTLPKAIDDATAKMDEFTKQAASNIQDTLGNTIEATLSGKFDSIADLWRDMLKNMASQAIAAQLAQSLLGDYGKTGQIGGLFGNIIGLFNAKGNAFGSSGVIPFANGGVVNSPTAFKFANGGAMSNGVMGEAGPEAIMPLKRGKDGRLGVASSGGNATVVNITQNIGAGVTRGDVMSLLQSHGAQLKGDILNSIHNGGAFAR